MANWQSIDELQDIASDLPRFTHALDELSRRLGLDITPLTADHILMKDSACRGSQLKPVRQKVSMNDYRIRRWRSPMVKQPLSFIRGPLKRSLPASSRRN